MNSPFPEKMPKWVPPMVALMFVASWIPFGLAAMYRAEPSPVPRMSIIPDMDKQEKFTAQMGNTMFADGRGMRAHVAGTVAYGKANTDDWLHRGIQNGAWATEAPLRPTIELLRRGQERYNVNCALCHGHSGYGNGMIATRAAELLEGTWIAPASLHDELALSRPDGHIFNSITNGIRTMPPYGSQIRVEDRWAIVLYVRALQRSQAGSLDDVDSPEKRRSLEATRMTLMPGATVDTPIVESAPTEATQ